MAALSLNRPMQAATIRSAMDDWTDESLRALRACLRLFPAHQLILIGGSRQLLARMAADRPRRKGSSACLRDARHAGEDWRSAPPSPPTTPAWWAQFNISPVAWARFEREETKNISLCLEAHPTPRLLVCRLADCATTASASTRMSADPRLQTALAATIS